MRVALSVFSACVLFAGAAAAAPRGAIALYGDLKYQPGFTHFDYANPDAPKGGAVKLNAIGTYDTFNPFTLKGVKADGLGYLFDTLMVASADEPDSQYGLVAQSVDVAPDRLSVTFQLRPEVRFHDGSPVTPADVIWTFDTLKAKGAPQYHLYYADVIKAEQVGEHGVKFTLRSAENRELPLILGELPVLSKKYWANRDFEKTTLDQPLGSGAYKISSYDPGRSDHLWPRRRLLGEGPAGKQGPLQFRAPSATIIIAMPRWRSKPSRPANTICARRMSRRIGRSATPARRCRRA